MPRVKIVVRPRYRIRIRQAENDHDDENVYDIFVPCRAGQAGHERLLVQIQCIPQVKDGNTASLDLEQQMPSKFDSIKALHLPK